MSEWIKKNAYYLKNETWTIAKYNTKPPQYALWNGTQNHGFYASAGDAKTKWKELTA